MPANVKGGIELRKALRKFTPDLAKETQKQLGVLLKPITFKARGFIPSAAPLSGWGKASGRFPEWNTSQARRGIGYRTTASKPNRSGFRSLARIVNASAAGAIYETAGRVNANGRPQARTQEVYIPSTGERYTTSTDKSFGHSRNPEAGSIFIQAINQTGEIVNARALGSKGRPTRKFKGRAIFRAWKEDGGKTNAAVLQAIEESKAKFYKAVGYN